MRGATIGAVALAAAILVLPCAEASACTWFVDGDAEPDGDGSAERPFVTIAQAAAGSSPGDRICLRNATLPYEGETLNGVPSGTEQAPITLTAAPGHAPVIAGSLDFRDVDYWVVRGLTFNGGGGSALYVRAFNRDSVGFELRDNLILDHNGIGINATVTDDSWQIQRIVIADNRIYGAIGFGIAVAYTHDSQITGNVIEQTRCRNLDAAATDEQVGITVNQRSERVEVAYNVIRNLSPCTTDETPVVRTTGIRVRQAGMSGEIHHNLVERVEKTPGSFFTGALSLHEGASDWWVHHNVVRDFDGCGLCVGRDYSGGETWGTSTGNRWEHNTVVDSRHGAAIGTTIDPVLVANVLVGDDRAILLASAASPFTTVDNLLWTTSGESPMFGLPQGEEGDFADLQAECGNCDEGSRVLDPRLDPVDGLTPLPDGPAIDAAPSSSWPAFHGEAADIGALEPPSLVEARLEGDEPATVVLRILEGAAPPLRPALGCDGFELEVDGELVVPIGCEVLESPTSELTLSIGIPVPVWVDSEVSLRYAGTTTDSARIGGRIGARLPAFELELSTESRPERPSMPPDPTGCGCRPSRDPRSPALLLPLLLLLGHRRSPRR